MLGAASRRGEPPPLSSVSGGALAWPSFFGAGRLFEIYVARLRKACILLGWDAKVFITAGRGPAKSGGETFSATPALTQGQLTQLVLTKVWGDERALISLIS